MSQHELPDQGRSNWVVTPCPQCGSPVAWTVASSYTNKLSCTGTPGDRSDKHATCGFTMRIAEWAYLREMPHKAAEMASRFGKAPKETVTRKRTPHLGGAE